MVKCFDSNFGMASASYLAAVGPEECAGDEQAAAHEVHVVPRMREGHERQRDGHDLTHGTHEDHGHARVLR